MVDPIYWFTFQKKTSFIHLKYVYPECFILREGHPQTNPLQCFHTSCPANKNCMETLAKRIHYLFDNVMFGTELLLVYFKNNTGSIRAGVFYKDLREPVVMTCNPYGFKKFQKEGETYKWFPTSEFYLIGGISEQLIVPTNLIR